jgi:hypothetical protein
VDLRVLRRAVQRPGARLPADRTETGAVGAVRGNGAAVIDLDDTSRCPGADACATCGAVSNLHLCTFSHLLGVHCSTLCGPCRRHTPPPMTLGAAQRAVLGHCEHLGIDLDQMAAAIAAENH